MLILHEAKDMYDKETDEVVQRGTVSEEAKRDFRYHLGVAEGMRRILKRVNEARESVKNR
jgi:hypothetical protein